MTETERTSARQTLGCNKREAKLPCLAALHNRYFLYRQYRSSAGVESGKAGLLLEQQLIENHHAKVVSFAYSTQFYHLCSRPFYHALGEGSNRHRRSRAPLSINAKLMGIDYVLGHAGRCRLATEREKLAYFIGKLDVDESALPVRVCLSKGAPEAERRFLVEDYPICGDAKPCSRPPVVSCC